MRIPVDCAIDSRTISLALVAIVEPITVSRLLTKEQKYAYLNPRSLYAAAAEWIICAVAALPTPRSRSGGTMVVFRIFPV